MAHPFDIRVYAKAGGKVGRQEGFFSDAHWSVLMQFLDEAEDLCASPAVRTRVGWSLRWTAGVGLEQFVTLPDRDQVDALLHRLRPFILEQETTYFGKVCSIVTQTITLPAYRHRIGTLRRLFFGDDYQAQVTISADDVVLNSDKMLRKWLNGFEYHRDPDKRTELNALATIISPESQRALYVSMLLDKVKAVRGLARGIHGLKVRGGHTCSMTEGLGGRSIGGTITLRA